jgi:hypothetical protein
MDSMALYEWRGVDGRLCSIAEGVYSCLGGPKLLRGEVC